MTQSESIDYQIKAAWHGISRMYNQQGQPFDITTSIGFVLLNIDAEEGTPATKIAPHMGLESRSLTRMLKSMEEKELIYRRPDEKDKRSVRVFLTDMGKIKKEIARKSVKVFNQFVKDTVDPEKMEVFFEVIIEINKLIAENKVFKTQL